MRRLYAHRRHFSVRFTFATGALLCSIVQLMSRVQSVLAVCHIRTHFYRSSWPRITERKHAIRHILYVTTICKIATNINIKYNQRKRTSNSNIRGGSRKQEKVDDLKHACIAGERKVNYVSIYFYAL